MKKQKVGFKAKIYVINASFIKSFLLTSLVSKML